MGFKSIFLQNERGKYDLKVEKMQNAPYFPYSLKKFIIQTSCLIAFTYQSVQNPWVPRNPWNFGDGFRNSWILNRLISKCNQTRRLDYKYL